MHENQQGEIRAFLLVRLGNESWIVDLLHGYELIVGRGKDADIRIDDSGVRDKHTGVTWNGKHIELRVFDGAEGVLVNGDPVTTTAVAKPGDEICIGRATLLVSVTVAPSNLGRRSLTHDEFAERLTEELARAARRMQFTSLIMLKVGSGDGSGVAHAALSSFRGGDIVGTYAHDEIEFLLPDTPFNIAKAVVKRLMETSGIAGASAGIAVAPDDGDSAERLLRAARDALAAGLVEGKDISQASPPPLASGEPPIHSPTTKLVVEDITEAAKGNDPVLLIGEPNSGKRYFSRLLHDRSSVASGPFVMIGCAGLVDSAAVSAAFGNENGDCGECTAKKATGGTLVLDEIGDLPVPGQRRLLALLERVELNNIRMVSTTHRDLLALCGAEAFLEALYSRLAVVRIGIPALRMRTESIVPLAENFAAQFNAKSRVKLSTGAVERMRTYAWPGNVLELQNAMERAVALADGGEILAEHLPGSAADAISGRGLLRQHVGSVERDAIIKMLADNNYNQTHTAKQLGISRRALIYKMEKYGLKPLPAGTRKGEE
jgi:hypothetical protein